MKQTRKLVILVMTALALTASANSRLEAALSKQDNASSEQIRKEKFTIASITFKGLHSLTPEELAASLPLKTGETIIIPGPELASSLEYLWNLGIFSDLTVENKALGGGKTALTFIVHERPVLADVIFKGNDKLNEKELKKLAKLQPGTRITGQELVGAASRIEARYAEKGYLAAEAKFRLEERSPTRADVIFSIDEGPKVCIEKITFHGNEAFSNGELRDTFRETHQNSWWRNIFGTPKLDRQKFAEDKDLLIAFYRNHGYRDAKVLRDSITYTKDKKGILLDIWVDEGPLYHIGTITWVGNSKDFATTEILNETFDIRQGDIYDAAKINERLNFSQEKTDVSSLYLDRGYLAFRATLEEQVSAPGIVDLTIYLREGDQFHIDMISIKGNTKTKDNVIRRELYTIPGDMFSRKNVVRSIRELNMLNYFNPEDLTPDISPNGKDNTVDLTYNVSERQTDTFNASVGYSDSGFLGSLGVTFNNFSLPDLFDGKAWDPIPHGDGQQLGLQWQFGDDDYRTIALNFLEPWAFGTPTSVGFSAYTSKRSYDYTDDGIDNPKTIEQYGATLSAGRRLTWPDDYFSINWKLKYLHTKGGFLTFVDEPEGAPDQADEVAIVQTITRNSMDNLIYPRSGSKNSLSAQLSGGPLPGTIDFYKFILSSSWYIPVVPVSNDLVWNLYAQGGYMDTIGDHPYVPYTEYFYMGGSGMSSLPTVPLRGYDDRSLGSRLTDSGDGTTDLWGGTFYTKFTTELRYPLTMSNSVTIYALTFIDAGNVWAAPNKLDPGELKKSAGFGLRLYLPIVGTVGLDYGYGFDSVPSKPDVGAQGWKFQFTFGTSNN